MLHDQENIASNTDFAVEADILGIDLSQRAECRDNKRTCVTYKQLWRVWQHSSVTQSLKSLWGQREGAFEEGICACFLAALRQRITHFVRRQGEFEVLFEVHKPSKTPQTAVKPGGGQCH